MHVVNISTRHLIFELISVYLFWKLIFTYLQLCSARSTIQLQSPVYYKVRCKRTQHCWPTTPNIVRSCYVRLHVAKSLTSFKLCATTPNIMQQGVQTDAMYTIQQCWELLANNVASVCTGLKRHYCKVQCKRTQHCWLTTPNVIGCYMLRPFAYPFACCCVLMGVVAQSRFETGQTFSDAQTDTTGEIHSTKISGNFCPKLNGTVWSNRKSFEKN